MPYKVFTDGNVLTASEVNQFLQQGVLVFDDAAARDAALTPTEGMVAFTKNDNATKFYDGAAWVAIGAAPNADFSNSATGTYTDSGINYKYITYTASGTLTVTTAGVADVLLVGGGGAGSSDTAGGSGGGAGGLIFAQTYYLSSGTATVQVGAGAAALAPNSTSTFASNATASFLNDLYAIGGGYAGAVVGGNPGRDGGSGGGGYFVAGGIGLGNQGNDGGLGTLSYANGGGGGGAGAAGGVSAGGAGLSNSITGAPETYAVGGNPGTGGGAGTTNRGNGGNGGATANVGNGGSGIVVVRVRT